MERRCRESQLVPRRTRALRGFTLVELLVVLAVLGLLLGLAVPRYLSFRKRGFKAEAVEILAEVKGLSWAYYQDHGEFPGALVDLAFAMPGGAAWEAPAVEDGGETEPFIHWEIEGNSTRLVTDSDKCSVVVRTNGSSAQGCNF